MIINKGHETCRNTPAKPIFKRIHRTNCRDTHKKENPGASVRKSGVRTGGGYLLSHFRSTIGVVRFNFSVRNGKRWIPHAIATLVLSVHGHALDVSLSALAARKRGGAAVAL